MKNKHAKEKEKKCLSEDCNEGGYVEAEKK